MTGPTLCILAAASLCALTFGAMLEARWTAHNAERLHNTAPGQSRP